MINKHNIKTYYFYLIPIFIVIIAFLLWNRDLSISSKRDYKAIISSGQLRVITEYNTLDYNISNDSLSGFYFDLISEFAKEKGLEIIIHPEMDFTKQIEGIVNGQYDILASSKTITKIDRDKFLYPHPHIKSRLVLVQKKRSLAKKNRYISSHLNLAYKKITIPVGSPIRNRIENLSEEIGDTIYIKEIEKYSSEQLMALVAHGDIDYTVSDEIIAKNISKHMPGLDISLPIGFNQFHSWIVLKESKELNDSINSWFLRYKTKANYKHLLNKYNIR